MEAKDRRQTVVDFNEHYERTRMDSLYREYDDILDEVEDKNRDVGYTELGMSIMDDVDYFLSHSELRDCFEKEFSEHLRVFSSRFLKVRASHD